jgi:hypothetical protein
MLNKCNLHFIRFSKILNNAVLWLYIYTSWTAFIINVFHPDNFSEKGVWGPTRVGGASQNIYGYMCISSGGRDFVPWDTPKLLNCGYRLSFLGEERPGRGVDHPPPSSDEAKDRVELYPYSSSGQILCYLIVSYLVWDSAFVKISGQDYRDIFVDTVGNTKQILQSLYAQVTKLVILISTCTRVQSRSVISASSSNIPLPSVCVDFASSTSVTRMSADRLLWLFHCLLVTAQCPQ